MSTIITDEKNAPDKPATAEALTAIESLETITVHWGEEKFSPFAYNSFGHGNFFYTTKIQPQESPEQAFERGWNFLDAMARESFKAKLKGFRERFDETQGNPSPTQSAVGYSEQAANFAQTDGNGFPENPIAKNFPDMITVKQLGMIRALTREMNLDADAECESLMKCKTDELSKKAASALIQHFQDVQSKGNDYDPFATDGGSEVY